jgi:hypothetical protein
MVLKRKIKLTLFENIIIICVLRLNWRKNYLWCIVRDQYFVQVVLGKIELTLFKNIRTMFLKGKIKLILFEKIASKGKILF